MAAKIIVRRGFSLRSAERRRTTWGIVVLSIVVSADTGPSGKLPANRCSVNCPAEPSANLKNGVPEIPRSRECRGLGRILAARRLTRGAAAPRFVLRAGATARSIPISPQPLVEALNGRQAGRIGHGLATVRISRLVRAAADPCVGSRRPPSRLPPQGGLPGIASHPSPRLNDEHGALRMLPSSLRSDEHGARLREATPFGAGAQVPIRQGTSSTDRTSIVSRRAPAWTCCRSRPARLG